MKAKFFATEIDLFIMFSLREERCLSLWFCVEVKAEAKKEDDVPQQASAANEWVPAEGDRSGQVKPEEDRYASQSRKRPYEDSRGYGYYEHREDRR